VWDPEKQGHLETTTQTHLTDTGGCERTLTRGAKCHFSFLHLDTQVGHLPLGGNIHLFSCYKFLSVSQAGGVSYFSIEELTLGLKSYAKSLALSRCESMGKSPSLSFLICTMRITMDLYPVGLQRLKEVIHISAYHNAYNINVSYYHYNFSGKRFQSVHQILKEKPIKNKTQ
jgi:hypothetical protein